jgi:hypothetical protein
MLPLNFDYYVPWDKCDEHVIENLLTFYSVYNKYKSNLCMYEE